MLAEAFLGDQDYKTIINISGHQLIADVPETMGGKNIAATPKELMLAALAACTAMTVKMYAKRKNWNIGLLTITVSLNYDKLHKPSIEKSLAFSSNLSDDQIKRLHKIAKKCPVAQMLERQTPIQSKIY